MNALLIDREKEPKKVINELEKAEESFLWQRSRQRWINDRERNKKLYHTAVKRREASNAISELYNEDGAIVNSQECIEKEAIDFYDKLYNKKSDRELY